MDTLGWVANDGANNPDQFKSVLCFYPQKSYGCKMQVDYNECPNDKKAYFSNQARWGNVSHWQPLPEPPKEE